MWKWGSYLRKSDLSHEVTQGTYCAGQPASEWHTCGVFGLIPDGGLCKGRTDAGVEGRRSNASMPIGALLCVVEILHHVSVCDRQT